MTEEITILKRYFAASHIPLCTIWLNDCVKWCKEEALGPNYTTEDLKFKVFEQWTLLDLRDVEVKQLPPLLSGKKKFTLNGRYSLQVMKVTDISKPKYWQLQRIRNETPKNLDKDETVSSSRVLLVTLTDGVQEVEAMEYRPISLLNLNITPGVKVKIIGPIEVRRGRLMLEECNIKIVGGEVDSLIVPNAAENVLAASLNLPLNPNPRGVQESVFNQENDVTLTMSTYTQPQNQTVRNVANIQTRNVNIQNPPNRNVQPILISNNAQTQNQPNIENTPMEELWREEMRIDQEIDELLEVERELETRSVNPKADITSDMFEDDFQMENVKIPDANDDLMNSLESENDIFENMDLDAHLDKIDQQINKKTDSILPIQTILKEKLKGKFKIKAKFKTVFEKLKIINDKFHLIIEVEDDSGSLIVKVQNEIVEILTNCTVERFISIQNSFQKGDSTAKLIEVLTPLKERLQNMREIMEIEIKSDERFPCLIKLN